MCVATIPPPARRRRVPCTIRSSPSISTCDAVRRQQRGGGGQPVALLHPQLRQAAHPRGARGARRRPRPGSGIRRSCSARGSGGTSTPRSAPCVDDQVAHRLAALGRARSRPSSVGAHLAQGGEQAGAQRVQPDVRDGQPRARHQQRRHQREGGGGGIARHQDRPRRPAPAGLAASIDAGRSGGVLDPRPSAPKWRSMFSVWSRVGSGSLDPVVPRRAEPGQQAAPTSPGPRRPAGGSRAAAPPPRRCTASGRRPPSRAPEAAPQARQRLGHPAHRPLRAARRRRSSPRRVGWPASMPQSSRAAVPELPMSSTSAGSTSPPTPRPATRQAPSAGRAPPRRPARAWRRRCAARPRLPAGR